jgi:hypothetical protein
VEVHQQVVRRGGRQDLVVPTKAILRLGIHEVDLHAGHAPPMQRWQPQVPSSHRKGDGTAVDPHVRGRAAVTADCPLATR